ncbi:hypothetical protein ACWKSP_04900 [Micromonosporaceae bacterium Da 78-11]
MTWTHLLPEAGDEPAGFVAPPRGPLMTRAWTGQPPPPDPTVADLTQAVHFAGAAVFTRQPGAASTVLAWPADVRRLAALRVHVDAVHGWLDHHAPDQGPARLMPVLIDERIRWSRPDLAWALRTADDYGLYDGAAFLLPGYIAASLSPAELAGFGRPLRAVFDEFIEQSETPRPVRRLLGELYGTAIWRLTGRLPLDLLPWHDPFGEFVQERLDQRLDEPGVIDLFRHATSLSKVSAPKKWLVAAGAFPDHRAVRRVLSCFVEHAGHISSASDELLRGLVWMLSLDPSAEATALLGRVAVTAGSAGSPGSGHPFAPQTAAAVVEILADRSGELPARILTDLSGIVANKALLTRVHAALDRRPA